MSNSVDKAQLEEILKAELDGKEDSAGRGEWTLDHCLRTARLAVTLRQLTGEPAELDDLLYTAGLFHDVAHDSASHDIHGQVGAERTRELLTDILPSDFLNQVTAIIAVHDDRRPDDNRDIATHLVQDADLIDHFGTPRVWAEFGYAAKHSLRLSEAVDRLQFRQQQRDRFSSLLHFEVSRQKFFDRLDFEAGFLERVCAESCGQIKF